MRRVLKYSGSFLLWSLAICLSLGCEKGTDRSTATTDTGPKPTDTGRTILGLDPYATLATKNFRSLYASLKSSLQISGSYSDTSANSFVSTYESFKYVLSEKNEVNSLVSVSHIQLGAQACFTAVYNDFEKRGANAATRIHIPTELEYGDIYTDAQILTVVERFTLALLGRLPTEEEKALLLEETKAFQVLPSLAAGRQARETGVFICTIIASSMEFLKQ